MFSERSDLQFCIGQFRDAIPAGIVAARQLSFLALERQFDYRRRLRVLHSDYRKAARCAESLSFLPDETRRLNEFFSRQ